MNPIWGGLGLAGLALAACQSLAVTGTGVASDGSTLAGALTAEIVEDRYAVRFASSAGWSCAGAFGGAQMRAAPLTCSDGVSGTMRLEGGVGKKARGTFRMSDGRTGELVFDGRD